MLRDRVLASKLIGGVAVAFLLVSLAAAQEEGQRRRGGGSGDFRLSKVMLLQSEKVQTELKVTDEQQQKLRDLAQQARSQGGQREQSREERQQRTTETEAKVKEILTAEQSQRLDEVFLQVAGPATLAEQEHAQKLGLEREQRMKIREIVQAQGEKMRATFQEAQGDREAIREGMAKVRKETEEQVQAILTADQKQQYEKMKGKPFEVDMRELFPRRRGQQQ